GSSAQSCAVSYELTTLGGRPALQVTADRAWLDDPARVYPVRIDPSTWTADDTGDVFVDNDSGTTNQNGNDLQIGTSNSGTTIARSFIHFDGFDADFGGMQITAASLKLYHTWSFDCTHHLAFSVSK